MLLVFFYRNVYLEGMFSKFIKIFVIIKSVLNYIIYVFWEI